MSVSDTDRDILRLISAFKEIKSLSTRRAIILLIEEVAQKDNAPKKPKTGA
jgi:hypothetical protein